LDLAKAKIPNLSLRGSYLHSRLSARRLQVAHTLDLSSRFHCQGAAFPGAHIGGQLNCTEATFTNSDGDALSADGMTVESVFLSKAQCTGEARLLGAQISGQLACDEATFTHPDGFALNPNGSVLAPRVDQRATLVAGPGVVPRDHGLCGRSRLQSHSGAARLFAIQFRLLNSRETRARSSESMRSGSRSPSWSSAVISRTAARTGPTACASIS
jgi:hypothetical protein